MNPYDMLNVRDNANDKEIKQAYLFYKNKYNPKDYSGDEKYAAKRIEGIEKAYAILSNPQLKAAYDRRYSTHVKSHITKKDVFKEYYVSDPIGTHEHKDYDMAMRKYNSRTPFLDFSKETIKTNGDSVFDDESIKDYSEFKTHLNAEFIGKVIVFLVIGLFAISILSPLFSIFEGFGEIFKNNKTPEKSNSFQDYYDSSYDSTEDYTYTYDSTDSYTSSYNYTSPSTSDVTDEKNINDIYTDTELRNLYNQTYSEYFNIFSEFKTYFNNLYINESN